MNDEELLRYSRQIMLPKIDIEGQQKLLNARVLIVGLGGLGSPVALYLAAAGVGKLILADNDLVDLSNLQRQIVHQQSSLNLNKAESAARTLSQINSGCDTAVCGDRIDEDWLQQQQGAFDLVVDCCDNFATRFLLNRFCFQHKIPLVSGAAIRWEGQLTSFLWRDGDPCYQCLYEEGSHTDQTCSQNGVAAPLVGIIGSLQAMEALKIITGAGDPICGELLLFDALDNSFRRLKFRPASQCKICGSD